MSHPFGQDDFLRVSYSSLNLFSTCPRKFEFSKLYPRRARDYDTFAADVGKALHRGYQTYLVTRSEDAALWAMMEVYPYELEWNQDKDYPALQAATVLLQVMIESASMLEYRVAQIKRPLTEDEAARLIVYPPEERNTNQLGYDESGIVVPAIEVPFELRMNGITLPDGRGIAITGFVDAFLVNVMTEAFRTIDIKTHRRFLRDATGKYKYDEQQVPYGIVLEHIQGKQIDEFEVLYLDCFVDLEEPRGELNSHQKDQDSIREWLINTVLKCQNIQRYMEMNYFPRCSNGCLNFNKPCFFLDIC